VRRWWRLLGGRGGEGVRGCFERCVLCVDRGNDCLGCNYEGYVKCMNEWKC
jgi:hypothetical protein